MFSTLDNGRLDLVVLALYVGFLAYLVFRLTRRTQRSATDYLLAGRALSLPAFVGTLVVSWYGGILGVGEYGFRYGISNWLVFGVPYYLAALVFAVFIAGKARRSPFVSIPDGLGRTYGPAAARFGGLIVFIMTAPATYVLMLGTLFSFIFGLPTSVGILLGTALSLGYVVRGGLKAVIRTDLFQFILMFGAFAISVIYLLATTGIEPLRENLPASHWTWHGGNSPQYIAVWFFIALATLIEPAFYQRVFAARTPAVARKGIFISLGFWVFFDMLSTTAALYARALLPADTDPLRAFPALAAQSFPPWLAALFFIGMLATIMSTVDTNGFIAATTLANLLSRDRDETTTRAAGRARWGILGTGVWAIGLALVSESIVDLWHGLGSIGTPALLLPMLGTFYPKLRIRESWILPWILTPALLAAIWLFAPGDGRYWWGIEPIYLGLGASLTIRLLAGPALRNRG
jgi:solute:Na+ symporter, SSS family